MKSYLTQHLIVHTREASNVFSVENYFSLYPFFSRQEDPKVSESPINRAKEVAEFSSTCNGSSSTDQRAENEGLLISSSTSGLHFSESPFIINVKQEEFANIKQEEGT